jgi:hypothetical protein
LGDENVNEKDSGIPDHNMFAHSAKDMGELSLVPLLQKKEEAYKV